MLRRPIDRRHAHAALPNVGAVLMHDYGPQLILSETYPVHLLSNLWALLAAVSLEGGEKRPLLDALMQPAVLEPLAEYLRQLSSQLNRVLATNFFARSELRLIHQLLTTDGMETYLKRPQLLQLVYNYLCCLSTAQATQIKSTFERFIFNEEYVRLDEASLKLLQQTCLEIVYPHIIAVSTDLNYGSISSLSINTSRFDYLLNILRYNTFLPSFLGQLGAFAILELHPSTHPARRLALLPDAAYPQQLLAKCAAAAGSNILR